MASPPRRPACWSTPDTSGDSPPASECSSVAVSPTSARSAPRTAPRPSSNQAASFPILRSGSATTSESDELISPSGKAHRFSVIAERSCGDPAAAIAQFGVGLQLARRRPDAPDVEMVCRGEIRPFRACLPGLRQEHRRHGRSSDRCGGEAHPLVCCVGGPGVSPTCFELTSLPFQQCPNNAFAFPDGRTCCPLDGSSTCTAAASPVNDSGKTSSNDASAPYPSSNASDAGAVNLASCSLPSPPGAYGNTAIGFEATTPVCSASELSLPGASCLYCCFDNATDGGASCLSNACSCPGNHPCSCLPGCPTCPP